MTPTHTTRLAIGLAIALAAAAGQAAFTSPSTPAFRGLSGAEYAGWEQFGSEFLGANAPDDPSTTAGASFAIVQKEPGALITGGGNLYSPAGPQDYELSHAPAPGLALPDATRVVLQLQTQGTELDYASVSLHFDAGTGPIALVPDVQTELARVSLGAQGFAVETAFEWDLTGRSEQVADYSITWQGAGAHMSLDAVLLDAYFDRAPESYCTAGVSASGCQAVLSASGTPSATAGSGFVVSASSVEGQKDGLFFFGSNGRQANSWGNGTSYQCVVPPVKRGGLLAGVGSAGACDGAFSQDLNARWAAKPGQNPGAGAVVQAQLWYRDPQNTGNQTTSLSDAVEFTVAP